MTLYQQIAQGDEAYSRYPAGFEVHWPPVSPKLLLAHSSWLNFRACVWRHSEVFGIHIYTLGNDIRASCHHMRCQCFRGENHPNNGKHGWLEHLLWSRSMHALVVGKVPCSRLSGSPQYDSQCYSTDNTQALQHLLAWQGIMKYLDHCYICALTAMNDAVRL